MRNIDGVYDVNLLWLGGDLGWSVTVYEVAANRHGVGFTQTDKAVISFIPDIPEDVYMDSFDVDSWFGTDDPTIPAWLVEQVAQATSHTRKRA
jgi:hypothetical protein